MSEAIRTGAKMGILETEQAILSVKQKFQEELSKALSLYRVSSPLFVSATSGIQDNLNGTERPVSFKVKEVDDAQYEIVHSLAKWKRMALGMYKIKEGKGLYTDMNAIRPDEDTLRSSIHSIYVDQWDWEKAITADDRKLDYLKETVQTIYATMRKVESEIAEQYKLSPMFPEVIHFIHTEDLATQYPELSRQEREDKACREYGAIFLIGIGGMMPSGEIHDGRAPDYDDWTTPTSDGHIGLNGDIIVWNPILERSYEISSMGIRVDKDALVRQLEIRGCSERLELPWHQKLMKDEMPLSIGGGIGQSRLCMFILQKRHIGEVQVGVWPADVKQKCAEKGICLL